MAPRRTPTDVERYIMAINGIEEKWLNSWHRWDLFRAKIKKVLGRLDHPIELDQREYLRQEYRFRKVHRFIERQVHLKERVQPGNRTERAKNDGHYRGPPGYPTPGDYFK